MCSLCVRTHRQEKVLSEREKNELRTAREHDRYAREEAFQVTLLALRAFSTMLPRPPLYLVQVRMLHCVAISR